MESDTALRSDARPLGARINYWFQLVARFALAFFFITYGLAKLNGNQFIKMGSVLDRPVSQLSGFELTWVYFGYSPLFSGFIAWGQLTCAVLLLFDRTKRIGMLALFPIILNIVLVNFCYNISLGTKVVSSIFLALNTYLILSEFPALKRFLWDDAVDSRKRPRLVERWAWVSFAVRVLLLAAIVASSWLFVTTIKTRFKPETLLTGDWRVEQVRIDGRPAAPGDELGYGWEKVYFEVRDEFAIRTDRGLLEGQYKLLDGEGGLQLRYNPNPSPPKTAAVELELVREFETRPPNEYVEWRQNEMEKVMTAKVVGTYQLAPDRSRLVISGTYNGRAFEIVLVPSVWEKY
jgi:uncharacterized membrane protein YphA (DoxX/SURF4 family)